PLADAVRLSLRSLSNQGEKGSFVMRIKTWTLGIAVAVVGLLGGRGDPRADYYTGWISEESPNNYTYCGASWNDGFNGFQCSGSYCDNVRFICGTLPSTLYGDSSTDHFTSWFSEEDEGGIIEQTGQGFGSEHLLNERYCNQFLGPPYVDSFGPAMVAGYKCSG